MTPIDLVAPIMALVIAIGGAWWVQRATGAREITEATKALLTPLREGLQEANEKIEKLKRTVEENASQLKSTREELDRERKERAKDRRRLSQVEKWARALKEQVVGLGGIPVSFDEVIKASDDLDD